MVQGFAGDRVRTSNQEIQRLLARPANNSDLSLRLATQTGAASFCRVARIWGAGQLLSPSGIAVVMSQRLKRRNPEMTVAALGFGRDRGVFQTSWKLHSRTRNLLKNKWVRKIDGFKEYAFKLHLP